MKALNYFFLLDNLFRKQDNEVLVDNLFLTLLHRLYYLKLLLLYMFCYYWL